MNIPKEPSSSNRCGGENVTVRRRTWESGRAGPQAVGQQVVDLRGRVILDS